MNIILKRFAEIKEIELTDNDEQNQTIICDLVRQGWAVC
jgi:hypothetical protein